MPITVEYGNRIKTMRTATFEIHHNKDAFSDFLRPEDRVNTVPLHDHDFYEVYCFLAGGVSYNIDGRVFHLVPGDILLIPPGTLHQPLFYHARGDYERVVLWISPAYLEAVALGRELDACFRDAAGDQANHLRPSGPQREALLRLMDHLAEGWRGDERYRALWERSMLGLLLCELGGVAQSAGAMQNAPSRGSDAVARTAAYIGAHLDEKLSAGQLAELAYLSRSHLLREFKGAMGTTLYRYIMQKRLIAARQLLREGVPPTAAACRCGFGEYSSFFRAFRAEYGVGPSEYLRKG